MYIPYYPLLSPFVWFSREQQKPDSRFPFDAPNVRYFDFARQGIYFVGRRLKDCCRSHILFPTYHCGTELNALKAAGVDLTFYNVRRSGDIDFSDIEAKISPQIDGLYFIHYNGFPQNIHRILKLKQEYGLLLLEDAAVSLFSQAKEAPLGSVGDVSFFSLYKTLAVPTGGMVVTKDPELLPETPMGAGRSLRRYLKLVRMHADWAAMKASKPGALLLRLRGVIHDRNTDTRAALTTHIDSDMEFPASFQRLVRKNHFGKLIEKRRSNFKTLLDHLVKRNLAPHLMYSDLPAEVVPSFFPIMVDERARVRKLLQARGIESMPYWDHRSPNVPYSAEVIHLKENVLGLPIHQGLDAIHMTYLADMLERALQEADN